MKALWLSNMTKATSAWTPAQRTTKLWLPSENITQTAGNWTGWTDASGNAFAVTSFGGSVPTVNTANSSFNNKQTVHFDGSNTHGLQAQFVVQAQPNTIYIVWNNSRVTANVIDGKTTRQIIGVGASNLNYYATTLVTDGALTSSPHAVAAVFNGASSALYRDSSAAAVAAGNPGANTLSWLLFGSSAGPTAEITGDIAEIIIYAGADSQAQVAQNFSYLGAKFGQAWS